MKINAFVVRNVLTRTLLRRCPVLGLPYGTTGMPEVFYIPEEAEKLIAAAKQVYIGHQFEIEDVQVVIGSSD